MPVTDVPVDAGWTIAPVVLLSLLAYLGIYVARWRRVRAHDGPRAAPVGRLLLFTGGILAVAAAIISPVDRISEQLASMHMVQHLLLADVAGILLVLGLTKTILRPVTRRIQWLERKAGPFGHPAFGLIAYVGAMWLWHIPALYDAALENPLIHVLEHLCFAASGFLYWWHLLSPIRSRMRLGGMGPIIYMATTKVLVGFLGILLAFSPQRLYDAYGADSVTRWGLTPLDDQHVAGALMGIEQSLVMGAFLAVLFYRMLAESEREDQRAERYEKA
jgi:cytochrome c oxidase assembly factor CtaG